MQVQKNALLMKNSYDFYHAHVYFDKSSLEMATGLCQEAANQFTLKLGRVHQKKVGPHPCWSCQLAFAKDQFDTLLPWLERHRQGLSVLIHADTGQDYSDHTEHAFWLGKAHQLELSIFVKE